MSECDLISKTITRKDMQDIRREIPAYADPFYRPHPNQLKYLHWKFQGKYWIQTLMHWNQTLTWILKKIPNIKV